MGLRVAQPQRETHRLGRGSARRSSKSEAWAGAAHTEIVIKSSHGLRLGGAMEDYRACAHAPAPESNLKGDDNDDESINYTVYAWFGTVDS